MLVGYIIKGALDNFSIIPQIFFKKVEIFVCFDGLSCEMNVCQILLASSIPFREVTNFHSLSIYRSRHR